MRCKRHRALYCIVDECRRADRARNRDATSSDLDDVVVEIVVVDPTMYDTSSACDVSTPDTACSDGG